LIWFEYGFAPAFLIWEYKLCSGQRSAAAEFPEKKKRDAPENQTKT